MTRARILSMVSVAALSAAAFLISAPRVQGDSYPSKPVCGASNSPLCTEVDNYHSAFGYYVGHDEPSLLFYSSTPGSGNNDLYTLDLPNDPPTTPVQDGSGGTFNFQLHPAFWFGMAMCDDQSAPNPGGSSFGATVPCTADNDANIFNSPDPTSPSYIGRHPGTAFITHNGVSQAPASPVNSTLATFTPDVSKDLFMNSGDALSVKLQDTPDGFQVVINDMTTGATGSMTASASNGFGEVQFAPSPATSCVNIPTNFHPMYSTSSTETRVPWAAHSYNVAFSDEIGHFEYCNGVNPLTLTCHAPGVNDPAGLDGDDAFCFSPAESSTVRIGG